MSVRTKTQKTDPGSGSQPEPVSPLVSVHVAVCGSAQQCGSVRQCGSAYGNAVVCGRAPGSVWLFVFNIYIRLNSS
jgi:hypothetical protein